MINSTIETVKGLIDSINDYLEDLHVDSPEKYIQAEQQRDILEQTLVQLIRMKQ